MLVITSLLWCPGAPTLAGPWEHAADSLGMCRPAALCDCWKTAVSVTATNTGSKRIMITKAKQLFSSEAPKEKLGEITICRGFE